MAKHKWSLWDGMRCLEVGTVEADDEKVALKAVAPKVALRPEKSYKVRIGADTVASFYPDEFARVQDAKAAHALDTAPRNGKPYLFGDMVKKLPDVVDKKLEDALKRLKEAVDKVSGLPVDLLKGPIYSTQRSMPSLVADVQIRLSGLLGRYIGMNEAEVIIDILRSQPGPVFDSASLIVNAKYLADRAQYQIDVADPIRGPGHGRCIMIGAEKIHGYRPVPLGSPRCRYHVVEIERAITPHCRSLAIPDPFIVSIAERLATDPGFVFPIFRAKLIWQGLDGALEFDCPSGSITVHIRLP